MADIYHTFTINASLKDVFNGISKPNGLNTWWTKTSKGKPVAGTTYLLNFGKQYQWKAIVTKAELNNMFELQMTQADDEWIKTKIGFLLTAENNITEVSFCHSGWRNKSENYKFSGYCWAMYLRILKRYIEYGEKVPYEKRLSV
jgi:uncharacterized protein YndB with AHSA1/START domain